jgi:hypothetical protein
MVAALTCASACGDDACDAMEACDGKNDRLITASVIIPICDAPTKRNGTRYSWSTSQGTCACTLQLNTGTGQHFWRDCSFTEGDGP